MALSNYLWYGYHLVDQTADDSGDTLDLPEGTYAFNCSVKNTGETSKLLIMPGAASMTIDDMTDNMGVVVGPGDSYSFSSDLDASQARKIRKVFVKMATGESTTFDVSFS